MNFIIDTYRLLMGHKNASVSITDGEGDTRELARKAASRFSRGNVAIQFGSFVTTEDLEKERREVAKLKFHN